MSQKFPPAFNRVKQAKLKLIISTFAKLTQNKIPWLFPDLEFFWSFSDQWQPCLNYWRGFPFHISEILTQRKWLKWSLAPYLWKRGVKRQPGT